MRHYCFCCGARLPEPVDVPHPRCPACTDGCKLTGSDHVARGPTCPFVMRSGRLRYRAGLQALPDLPPEVENAPVRETARTGVVATGLPAGKDFVWRGRARRNVPGG